MKVDVKDTTGEGYGYGAGRKMGLNDGKKMEEEREKGKGLEGRGMSRSENVRPRFLPREFGLEPGRAAGEQLTFDI